NFLRQHLDELHYRARSQRQATEPPVPGAPRPSRPMRKPSSTMPENPLTTPCAVTSTIVSPGAEPMPTSLDQFLAELRLVHAGGFRELVRRLATKNGPPDVAQVARELVLTKVLTPYQATALCRGKGRELLVGPYVVLDKIGTGGMAMVFKAVHR